MCDRYIAIYFEPSYVDPEKLRVHPNVEIYVVGTENAEHKIEMALLNDLIRPLKLAIIGSDLAKRMADLYMGTYIEAGPFVEHEVIRFWGLEASDRGRQARS